MSRDGVGFVGFRTDRFDEMVALFRDRIGLEVIREAPGATWFRLGDDIERTDTNAWCHFRAPDGTVLEIIGPASGKPLQVNGSE